MIKGNKEALIVLGIAIPLLCYGAFSFEFGGAGSTVEAISVAVSLTLGLAGVIGGLVLFFKKIKEEKEMEEIKDGITKEKPEPIDLGRTTRKSSDNITEEVTEEVAPSESIYLMKREKVLVERVSELNGFLNETETKLSQVRENLETKGWVNSDNGWVID